VIRLLQRPQPNLYKKKKHALRGIRTRSPLNCNIRSLTDCTATEIG